MAAKLGLPARVVDTLEEVYERVGRAEDPVTAGKQVLVITANRGAFIRPCPGTRNYTCCDYTILHIGTYCTLDCAYCILQAYFHPPLLQFFANHDVMLDQLEAFFQAGGPRRIGTGEFTDSLIWQRWFDLSAVLVPRFGSQKHAVLELKTKTVAIESMERLAHNKKTIMAWSLNTEKVIAGQERGTASLKARLSSGM
jgi:spore photoproduct lyase